MIDFVPSEVQKIALVLLLTLLIGLVQEERKSGDQASYVFGGVRTFPFFGIIGYTTALLAPNFPAILAVGFACVGALMLLSFYHKLTRFPEAGITSESSGLLTFLLGAVVYQEHYWIATTLVVLAVLLLELKSMLEGLAKSIPSAEIITFTKFLLLAAVILPVLPHDKLTDFQINPQRVWLIVCAISGISYISYILQKLVGEKGTILSAVLGGAYSSTATTIALSKRSVGQGESRLYSGAILISSGVMYIRIAILVGIFSSSLRLHLAPILIGLGVIAIGAGALWSRGHARSSEPHPNSPIVSNPLEIRSAIMFAVLFLVMLIITPLVAAHLGDVGIYGLSIITGVTDVDPFILGLTQTAGQTTSILTAASGILIAASSNNIAKGVYSLAFADHETGRLSFIFLSALAIIGLAPLAYFLTVF